MNVISTNIPNEDFIFNQITLFASAAARSLWRRGLMAVVLATLILSSASTARAQCDITISPGSLLAGTIDVPYNSVQFMASGANGTFTFSLVSGSGSPPANMTLSTSGLLSGTPVEKGSFPFKVKALATNGCSGTNSYTLTINCSSIYLTFSPDPLPSGTAGSPYPGATFSGNGGQVPYTYSATGLPAAMQIGSQNGLLSGTPNSPGTYPITISATDSNGCVGSTNLTLTINCPTITLSPSTSTLPAASRGVSYSQSFTPMGGAGPYLFSYSGSLPQGLSLSPQGSTRASSATISGTPTASAPLGPYNVTITSTDTNNCTGSMSYTLTLQCPSMSGSALPDGTIDVPYNQTITVTGGTPPYTFEITSGSPPSGLGLSGGTLSGTPNSLDSGFFGVQITDAHGCSETTFYNISINCPTITLSPTSLPAVTDGSSYSQTITASGYSAFLTYSVSPPLPNGLSLSGSGSETSISGLLEATPGTYYFTVMGTQAGPCTGSQNYSLKINSCISLLQTNPITIYTCSNCAVAPFTNLVTDPCCTNLSLSFNPSTNTCFPVNTTNQVQVTATNTCGDSNLFYVTVIVLPGNCQTNCTTGFSLTNFSSNALAASGQQLILEGSAAAPVTDGLGMQVLRLTSAATFEAGSAFLPVQLGNNLSFSAQFSFQMTNGGGSSDGTGNPAGADGIVFALAQSPGLGGSAYQVGYEGLPRSVAVKFDTWDDSASGAPTANDPNGNFVAVYTDGSVNTAGYGLYSPSNPGTDPQYYSPSTSMKNGDIWYAWIDYNGDTSELDVRLSDGVDSRPTTPQLIQNISLDNTSFLGLNPQVYAGFTSGTGGAYDDNDILSWQFTSPCTNACLTILCSNVQTYACGTNCVTVPLTAVAADSCCTNATLLLLLNGQVLQTGTNSVMTDYCFPVNSTNTVQVNAYDNCGNAVTNFFTVTVLSGPGTLAINYQYQNNNVILTWSQGILQESPIPVNPANNQTVAGPYSDVRGATSPDIIQPAGTTRFYRLRCQCLTCSNCLTLNCPSSVTLTTCSNCITVPLSNYVGVVDNCCTNWYDPAFNYPADYCFSVDTTNTIEVVVTDTCGNMVTNSFQLIVLPCANDTNCIVSLTCPGTIYAGTCSNTATVTGSATLAGCTNGVSLLYSALSGFSDSLSSFPFPVGTNTVTAEALQDGNTIAECDFQVIVTNASCGSSGAIVEWTFEDSQPGGAQPAGVLYSDVAPELGSGTASALHQGAATYSSPAGNGSDHSFGANNWTVGDYFQFACPTINASGISIAWDQVSSASGPRLFQLQYSADGANFTDFGVPYAVGANGTLSGPAAYWGSESNNTTTHYEQDLSSVSSLANAAQVWFRLVDASTNSAGGAGVGPFGASRVDNFTVAGVVSAGAGGTPELTWPAPAPIPYGTLLGQAQLNATATVPGGPFNYSPPAGTILPVGSNRLSVTFMPSTYEASGPITDVVSIVVFPVTLTVSADNAARTTGEPNPAFTGSVLGVVNSDYLDPSNSIVSVSYSCSATSNSPEGDYAIIPFVTFTNGSFIHYTVVTNPGTMTVTNPAVGGHEIKWTFEVSQPSGNEAADQPITGILPEFGAGVASALHTGAAVYSHPSGNGSSNSFSATNWAVGDYFQFACSNLSGGFGYSVSWDQVSSDTGPAMFQLQYSTDGLNFTDDASYQVYENGALSGPSPYWDFTTLNPTTHYIENLGTVSALIGQPTLWFRLVNESMTSADGGKVGPSGASRVDNFTVVWFSP